MSFLQEHLDALRWLGSVILVILACWATWAIVWRLLPERIQKKIFKEE